MTTHFFTDAGTVRRLHEGPLGGYIEAYAALIESLGYARQSARIQIRLVADLSRWLHRKGLAVHHLNPQRVHSYLNYRQRCLRPHRGDASALGKLLGLLRESGGRDPAGPRGAGSHNPVSPMRSADRNGPGFAVLGRPLESSTVRRTFYQLSRQTSLRGPSDHHGPRLHDFRHRFAVQTLVEWYRSGQDVERRLPILPTFLGHAHVGDTYWYLSACPELMGLAKERIERRWEACSCKSLATSPFSWSRFSPSV